MKNKAVNRQSVQISNEAKEKLETLRSQTKLSNAILLERAIELLYIELRSNQLASDLADLANNPVALQQYHQISAAMDGALVDA